MDVQLLIQVGEDTYEVPAKKVAAKKTPAKKSPPKSRGKGKSKGDSIRAECEDRLEALERKAARSLLKEYDAKTIDDVEDDDLEDLLEDLKEEAEDSEEESDGIDVEAVKVACQAFAKTNGKEELNSLLKDDYGINTVRGLGKLNADDLADLYADVTDA